MAPAIGLVVSKRFIYRGNPDEEWSNKYWLTGTPPTTSAAWQTLFDQLVSAEKQVYTAQSHVVGGIGYDDDTPKAHAVWSVDYRESGTPIAGTLPVVVGNAFAGDQAGMLELRTERKSTRGKWIYLRKFIHSGAIDPSDPDKIDTGQLAAMQIFAGQLMNGVGSGGHVLRSQKQVETLAEYRVSPYVTTRTLKRRGKRPS